MSNPKIGDVWETEGNDGRTVTAKVTEVEPPDSVGCFEWSVALDGRGLAHVGWWYGQGWAERECPCCGDNKPLVGCRSGYSACEECRVQMPGEPT